MARRRQIYEGKAKILYEGPEPGTLIQYFKDDATAFNAQKRGTISGKGVINNRISEHIFTALQVIGVPTHFIRRLNMREQLIRQVEIIPIEVVVRNVAAGSLSKRLGIEEGTQLPRTIIEYYYKDDALGDPMIADEHIACFGWATQDEMNDIADMAIRVNDFLSGMFAAIGIRLIDFKLEFGRVWDGDYRPRDPRRRDQPRRLPPVGHQDQPEARQGPLPPGPRRRRGSLSGSRAPARPAPARRGIRRCSTSTATARSGASSAYRRGLGAAAGLAKTRLNDQSRPLAARRAAEVIGNRRIDQRADLRRLRDARRVDLTLRDLATAAFEQPDPGPASTDAPSGRTASPTSDRARSRGRRRRPCRPWRSPITSAL